MKSSRVVSLPKSRYLQKLADLRSLSSVVSVLVLSLILSVAGGSELRAQSVTSGDIVGVVTDPSGGVLPNTSVTLKSQENGSTQTESTNARGAYRFSLLPPGHYTVSVSVTSFQEANALAEVTIGQTTTVNLSLALAEATSTVEVSLDAPLLQTENEDVSTSFTQTQISQVPNPGNDLSYIAQTAPGVVQNTQGGNGNFSTYGLPATSNLFTLNGQNENDPFLNLNNSGATFNNQNGAPRPFVNANQWAASLGGPIHKDKTFFFVNTEGLRFVLPTSANVRIPSPQFEAATLANLWTIRRTGENSRRQP